MARKKFSAAYEAGDILGLYRARLNDGDETRLRSVSEALRAYCRLEHAVNIPDTYKAISKDVRTPYMRDAWSRISASLVAKPPVVHVQPKDEKRQEYRAAAADASRFDMAMIERLNKETGEDTIYSDTAALVRDGESVMKVVHKPDAYANFPKTDNMSPDDALRAQEDYKKGVDLPIAWRNVDRLSMLFGDGEFGDDWALEYGEYPQPYLKRRYGMRELEGRLVNPREVLGGRPKPEGYLSTSTPGRAVKVEFFDDYEWHVIIDGSEAPGWPKPNPYAPHLPYFRAKGHESESLLYSLLWLVPRLDELLTMKLNWAYLGSYPMLIEESVPQGGQINSMEGGMGSAALPEKPLILKPGQSYSVPAGRTIRFLAPPPVGNDTNDLLQILRGLVEIAGIPSVMRGASLSGDSGYLANQMLTAATIHYNLAAQTLRRQHEQALDFVHWLIPSVIKQSVWVQGWQELDAKSGRPKEQAGRAWLALSPDKQGPNMAPINKLGPVTFRFRPTLPTNEQALAMIAMQLTQAEKPLSSIRHAMEEYLKYEDPDAIIEEIKVEQMMDSEPLLSLVQQEALKAAGIQLPQAPQPTMPAIDPAMLAGALGGALGGAPMMPPGPGQLTPQPNGQTAAGMPGIPGLTMPVTPSAPVGIPGLPAGAYPGQPPNQGG